jgi:hypothetical protein
MKRTFKYALATVLGAAIVAPAFAQDNFPDVPENHWAFEALAKLKAAGILVGYPDGLYRGGRPASRYELAVALHAAYQNLKNITDGLQSQINDLKRPGQATDLQPLMDRITALENQVNAMKGWGDDIANLKRMADTFQKELQSLGVDVEAMKRDLGDLADRVAKLEARKPAVDITGDVNMWMGAGTSQSGNNGLDMDGRINGIRPAGAPGPGRVAGLPRDVSFLHEVALTLAGTKDTGPKWKGTVVIGNMLSGAAGTGFGTQSMSAQGFGYRDGAEDIYIQDFSVKFDTSLAGLGFNADLGRVGYKVSPYIFQRLDKTSYMTNDRWDNGMYYFDGGILGFNFGAARLDIFGGRNGNRFSVNSTDINEPVSGPIGGMFSGPGGAPGPQMPVDRHVGANLNIPLTTAGNLNLAYLFLASPDAVVAGGNRINVYGGTLDWGMGDIKLQGAFAQSDLLRGNSAVNNSDNRSWQVKAGWEGSDRFGLWGAYREVEANFIAPGDWGRLGIIRNPANIRGFQVGGHFNFSDALKLEASGEFDKGKSSDFGATTGFNTDTNINKFSVGLGYKVNPNLDLSLGYENTEFRDLAAIPGRSLLGNPRYTWTTFGLGYGLSDAARLTFQYQISDVKNEFVLTNGARFQGGFLTTQLSLKF